MVRRQQWRDSEQDYARLLNELERAGALPHIEEESETEKQFVRSQLSDFLTEIRAHLGQYTFFKELPQSLQTYIISLYQEDYEARSPVSNIADYSALNELVENLESATDLFRRTRDLEPAFFERSFKWYFNSHNDHPLAGVLDERVTSAVEAILSQVRAATPSQRRNIYTAMQRGIRDKYLALKASAGIDALEAKLADPEITGAYSDKSAEAVLSFLNSAARTNAEIVGSSAFVYTESVYRQVLAQFGFDPYTLLEQYGIIWNHRDGIPYVGRIPAYVEFGEKHIEGIMTAFTRFERYEKRMEALVNKYYGDLDTTIEHAVDQIAWLRNIVAANSRSISLIEVPKRKILDLTPEDITDNNEAYLAANQPNPGAFSNLESRENADFAIRIADFKALVARNGPLATYFKFATLSPEEIKTGLEMLNTAGIGQMQAAGINYNHYFEGLTPRVVHVPGKTGNLEVTIRQSRKDFAANLSLPYHTGREDLHEPEALYYILDVSTQFVEISWDNSRKGHAVYFAAVDESGTPTLAINNLALKDNGKELPNQATAQIINETIDYITSLARHSGFQKVIIDGFEGNLASRYSSLLQQQKPQTEPAVWKLGAEVRSDLFSKDDSGRLKAADYIVIE